MVRLLSIVADSVVDGPGLRTVIFFAGCPHRCRGCHNPSSWSLAAGATYSTPDVIKRVEEIESKRITLSGGEPFAQIEALEQLVLVLRPDYEIYLFTGYRIEDLVKDERACRILRQVDCLIDGPYMEQLHDTSLAIRGSTNQRILSAKQIEEYIKNR
ncbi:MULTISPECIES: anaerobic ribonucleoside-triphosphate reductase activating protein [unclassified Exiguobacterium]|uniref:anaerobic ribonucleoside-triphosphate reductase activating protein n=1 Tax=unclassified Exiguobacterium TaxID=2644629 RepID=UPI001BED341B|nr:MULTISPECIES: anaerobic ribonucleoside-triphosphate reductase activating protein [unclassified Exiguobacterium]